jgi:hypothetical protein
MAVLTVAPMIVLVDTLHPSANRQQAARARSNERMPVIRRLLENSAIHDIVDACGSVG